MIFSKEYYILSNRAQDRIDLRATDVVQQIIKLLTYIIAIKAYGN